MSQTASHLVDHDIRQVPVRQRVLSLQIPLRVLLAAQPELVTPVLRAVQRKLTLGFCLPVVAGRRAGQSSTTAN